MSGIDILLSIEGMELIVKKVSNVVLKLMHASAFSDSGTRPLLLRLKINTEKEGGGAGDVNTYSV
jgi:hypothetical protein